MKVVLAPNAFKGSLAATAAAAAMARGARRAVPGCAVVEVPVADGGDGLHDVALALLGGDECAVTVTGPRGAAVAAGYVRAGDRAIIESARASGIALLGAAQLDPTATTTLGTGELIRAALDGGARRLVVGVGGSASNDGGVGMATALGWRFLDAAGAAVEPVGGALAAIVTVDGAARDPRLADVDIEVACDVDNPLCGESGAAAVYAPQKGATPQQVVALDRGLAHLADLVAAATGSDERAAPGAGAGGGLGFGLRAFAGGVLRGGTDILFEAIAFDERIAGADLVLTGEGRLDAQTSMGKAPARVAERARRRGIPCFALAGAVGERLQPLHASGIDAVFSIAPGPRPLAAAMAATAADLERCTEQVVRAFVAGRGGR